MRQKFRISFIDFMPQYGKFPIAAKDGEGNDLHVGDIVQDDKGDKHYIGYRYGSFMLKQPFTMHSIMVKDYSRFKKINELWSVMSEYIIIGYDTEPFYEAIREIPDLQLIEA
jgi:hypothetical protein